MEYSVCMSKFKNFKVKLMYRVPSVKKPVNGPYREMTGPLGHHCVL